MSSPSRPRRKPKLTPFTVDELLDNPAMSGFVSFLEVHPEQRTSLPQPIEAQPVSRPLSDGTLPPESSLEPGVNVPPGGNLHPDSNLQSGGKLRSGTCLPPDSTVRPDGSLPPEDTLPTDGRLPPDSRLLAGGTLPSDSTQPPGGTLLPDSTLLPDRSVLSGSELRTENGRTVRIRQARGVQDAHTSAEHTLWQMLWRKGSDETPSTRLIKAGLAEVSRWTGAHKTSCRAYLRALIAKLAIEEAETFNASAGKDGARTYRVYSAESILDRRRAAGFTHVIRTGAVTFVDPVTGRRLLPGGDL